MHTLVLAMPPTDDDVKAARELSRCSNAPQCWLCGEYFKPCRGCVEANRIALVISAARERGAREEREACAVIVDAMPKYEHTTEYVGQGDYISVMEKDPIGPWIYQEDAAAAIRARGTT